jgi:hypothetical protein
MHRHAPKPVEIANIAMNVVAVHVPRCLDFVCIVDFCQFVEEERELV